MAETLVELVARISADASELKKGLADAEGKTEQSSKNMADSIKKVGLAMTVAGAAITAALGMMVKSFISTGSELHDLSLKTGVSVKALAGLQYAAEQNGASLGTVEMAIRRTASAMQDIKDGSAESIRAFDRMGLSLTDLQGLNPEEQFMKIAGAIANIPDPMTRAATAQDLFGRSGMDMLPMLSEGAEGLQRMMEEGVRLTGWTDEGANSADALGDAFGTLKTSTMGIFNVIGSLLTPVLKDLIDKITNAVSNIVTWAKDNPKLAETITKIALAIGVVLTVLGTLLLIIPKIKLAWIAFQLVFTASPIGLIITAIVGLVAAGIALWQNWDTVSHFFQDAWSNMKNAVLHAVDFMLGCIEKFLGWIPGLGDKIRDAREAISNIIDANTIERNVRDAERSMKEMANATNIVTDATKQNTQVVEDNTTALKAQLDIYTTLTQKVKNAIEQYDYEQSSAGKLRITLDDVIVALHLMNTDMDSVTRILQWLGDESNNVNVVLKTFGLTAETVSSILGRNLTKATNLQTVAIKEQGIAVNDLGNTYSTMADKIESAFDKIKRLTGFAGVVAPNWPVSAEAMAPQAALWAEILDLRAQGKDIEADALLPAARAGMESLYNFASGGVVPGPIGMPQLATVHGGETIIPANESMGNVVINFTQPVFFDREDTMNRFVDMIRKGIQRQDRLRFGGAYAGG